MFVSRHHALHSHQSLSLSLSLSIFNFQFNLSCFIGMKYKCNYSKAYIYNVK
uniref:Uncharacterized protein n=1 Tax=Anguilla anguilla TaxID=7936 RepID=A0A0E9XMS2_ANGAN